MLQHLLNNFRLIADLSGVGLIGVLVALLKWKNGQLEELKVQQITSVAANKEAALAAQLEQNEVNISKIQEEYNHAYNELNPNSIHTSSDK